MAQQINYLGEVMVHKPSRKVGPVMHVEQPVNAPSIEITLRTEEGLYIKGDPSEFELANKEEYFSFVHGWFSKLSVSMY